MCSCHSIILLHLVCHTFMITLDWIGIFFYIGEDVICDPLASFLLIYIHLVYFTVMSYCANIHPSSLPMYPGQSHGARGTVHLEQDNRVYQKTDTYRLTTSHTKGNLESQVHIICISSGFGEEIWAPRENLWGTKQVRPTNQFNLNMNIFSS